MISVGSGVGGAVAMASKVTSSPGDDSDDDDGRIHVHKVCHAPFAVAGLVVFVVVEIFI